jgi:hypothetical protein
MARQVVESRPPLYKTTAFRCISVTLHIYGFPEYLLHDSIRNYRPVNSKKGIS